MPEPPAIEVEGENPEAATTKIPEANDVVMAEANVEPTVGNVPVANKANEATEVNATPDINQQPEVNATAHVPPPRSHTIEQAYNYGQLVNVRWPILIPPPAAGPQFDYHVEHRPQVQKPKPRLPRFPGTATRQDLSMSMASLHTTPSSIKPRTHIPSQKYHLIGSGVISSATTTLVFYTIKGACFLICV